MQIGVIHFPEKNIQPKINILLDLKFRFHNTSLLKTRALLLGIDYSPGKRVPLKSWLQK
jgi:hypothetical protein